MQDTKSTNQSDKDKKSETIEVNSSIPQQINQYFPHPYINAFVALLVFLLLGKLIDWLITGVASKLVGRTKSDFDDEVLNLLHRPIFLSFVLFGLAFSTNLLGLPQQISSTTIHVLQTIAVLVWFRFGLEIVKLTLDKLELHESRFTFITPTTKPILTNSLSIILIALSVYIIFLIWKINITAWIASAGIVGLAISFAAKDTLANIFGGIAIFADKPFKVGDFVNLDKGERGMITQIGIRSTRVITRDDVEITVPNGVLVNTTIVNESGGPDEKYRVRLKVGIGYDSDLDVAESVLLQVANNHEEVCESPSPRVRFRLIGASSLNYELLCWIEKPVLRGRVLHELNREVFKELKNANIEMPYTQQDIYIKQLPQINAD